MKYLVLLAVIFAVLWFLRNNRRDDTPSSSAGAAPRRTAPPPVQQEMVECAVCKVHLPRTDALPGPGGRLYCCTEHVRKG